MKAARPLLFAVLVVQAILVADRLGLMPSRAFAFGTSDARAAAAALSNTADVTLAAVGSSPNANGASLSGQVLTLQPADGSTPGLLTATTQTIGGAKTLTGTVNTRDIRPLAGTDDANDVGTSSLRYRFMWMSKYLQISGYANASLPTCNSSLKGAISYDTTNDKHVGCNGSAWTNMY